MITIIFTPILLLDVAIKNPLVYRCWFKKTIFLNETENILYEWCVCNNTVHYQKHKY